MILCLCRCEWLSLCFVLSSCSELLCVAQVCSLQPGAWNRHYISVSHLPPSLPSFLFSATETWRAPSAGAVRVVIGRHAWVAATALIHHWRLLISGLRVLAVPRPYLLCLPPFASAAKCMVHRCCGQDYLKNLLKLTSTFFFLSSFLLVLHLMTIKRRAFAFARSHFCVKDF